MKGPYKTVFFLTLITAVLVSLLIGIYSPGDFIRDGDPDTGTILFIKPNPVAVLRRSAAAVALVMSLPLLVLVVSKVAAAATKQKSHFRRRLWLFWLLAMVFWLFAADWYPLSD
ncbi:hypothetical protein J7E24_04605 [Hymenobacter sp. ISL-91]|uniref:hypothetical protein n=1 Tax=Hymenobacter sp. ISL-91 TaxID=2819151 RepID=UPI001BE6293A|nr:hypothetical protein [Hymenobacter sp. ISL-91]MBT2557054.1 hypothetical protein [Hymenobacter sp. ISL-91]